MEYIERNIGNFKKKTTKEKAPNLSSKVSDYKTKSKSIYAKVVRNN